MHLQIMEQLSPRPPHNNRYRIVEVYMSIDGPRTRLSDKSFATLQQAEDFIAHTKTDGQKMVEAQDLASRLQYPDTTGQ